MSGFVWYSFGSDKTGPILGKVLGFDAGKKTPKFDNYDVVVGWGCKPGTKYDSEALAQLIAQNQVRILNHPDAVSMNRDKLGTLERLRELGIGTPGFYAFDPKRPQVAGNTLIPDALEKGVLSLPLVLLTKYNKGAPIFCYTIEDVKAALTGNTKKEHPLCYARTFDQGDEYRIHVFRDTALCAQKKDLSGDPLAETTQSLWRRTQARAKKDKVTLDKDSVIFALKDVALELVASASQLKKSVKMGWKWLDWGMELIPPEVAEVAIEAMDAVKLDMGAVSVSHVEGVSRVLSITTAPALSEGRMELYATEIQAFAAAGGKTRDPNSTKAAKKEKPVSPELVAKLYRKMKGLSAEKAEEVLQSLEE